MAESPEREITFRREQGETDRTDHNNFEDANETLDEPRAGAHGRGDGDFARIHGAELYRQNTDCPGDRNTMVPYKLSIKPETYDGVEDWEEYISHFEICSELGRWSDHEKVLALAMALKGPARTFYISLSMTEKQTYQALVQRLSQRFGSTRQQNRWLSRLEMRKRGQGESVAALADDLRQMAQRAYSDLDSKAQEVLALNQLYKSVSPEVKYQCTNQECKTVTDAVEIIERYEAIIGDSTDKKRSTVRMVSEENCPEQNTAECNRMTDTLNKLTRLVDNLGDRSNQTNRGYSKSGYTNRNNRRSLPCHFCGKTDHLIKNCSAYLKYKEEYRAKQQTQNTSSSTGNQRDQNVTASTSAQGNFNSPLAH